MNYAPISEAPRDGSPVLATWEYDPRNHATVYWMDGKWWDFYTDYPIGHPTHYLVGWRPLGAEDAPDGKTVPWEAFVVVTDDGDALFSPTLEWAIDAAGSMGRLTAIHRITAALPLPSPTEIAARVEKAE